MTTPNKHQDYANRFFNQEAVKGTRSTFEAVVANAKATRAKAQVLRRARMDMEDVASSVAQLDLLGKIRNGS